MKKIRLSAIAAAATALALVAAGCGSDSTPATSTTPAATTSSAASSAAPTSSDAGTSSSEAPGSASEGSSTGGADGTGQTVIIGSADFGESELLMNIYAGALEAKNVTVELKPRIGSREAYIPALQDGSIDLVPEYSGVLLAYFDAESTAASSEDIYAALPAAVGDGLKVLDQSAAEDKDSIGVTADTAAKYNLKTIADLQPVAGDLILGGAPEFETRPDGVPGLLEKYGVEFSEFKTLDAGGPLTVAGLKNGQVDAADLFTTDPAIEANGFVILEDPENLYTAQNVLPLINAEKSTPAVEEALNAVSAVLTTEDLIDLNSKVAAGTASDAVADAWLSEKGLS
ncbi:glycine/betaine ABC transporter substrate-binding protein [Nakamurella sp. YIM 132087]|uniref:Glycine/betaine ABC transporter substrate-binding protein n=1 Tax=Nakamurella alba TaxID=2665158 RepID=A0A7K1FK54_9ACTN|nr:ABC transporter substrate-binding protein [Nakamurella alba]MTD14450.1 glycine/betaine ABC transporter substrate-binding protein [Nakamurella alba]